MAEIDVLQGSRLAQFRFAQPGGQAPILPVCQFPVRQQSQAFFKFKTGTRRHLPLFLERMGHAR